MCCCIRPANSLTCCCECDPDEFLTMFESMALMRMHYLNLNRDREQLDLKFKLWSTFDHGNREIVDKKKKICFLPIALLVGVRTASQDLLSFKSGRFATLARGVLDA